MKMAPFSSVSSSSAAFSAASSSPRAPSPAASSLLSSSQVNAPLHPVASMREAFTESIIESDSTPDSSPPAVQSQSRPSKHHRLRKLVAQLAFGLYLLHSQTARSESTVIGILQTHIDDFDSFLSSTTSNFDLAHADISIRLAHLRLPLASTHVFGAMLEAGEFRREMRSRIDAVGYIARRTSAALQHAVVDVKEGLGAVDELAEYLMELQTGWRTEALENVFRAMRYNTAMWFRACAALQRKADALTAKLKQLDDVVVEIEGRCMTAGGGSAQQQQKLKQKATSAPSLRNRASAPATVTRGRAPVQVNKPLPAPPTTEEILLSPSQQCTTRIIEPPKRSSSLAAPSSLHRRLLKRPRSAVLEYSPCPYDILLPPAPRPEPKELRRKASMFRRTKSWGDLGRRTKPKKEKDREDVSLPRLRPKTSTGVGFLLDPTPYQNKLKKKKKETTALLRGGSGGVVSTAIENAGGESSEKSSNNDQEEDEKEEDEEEVRRLRETIAVPWMTNKPPANLYNGNNANAKEKAKKSQVRNRDRDRDGERKTPLRARARTMTMSWRRGRDREGEGGNCGVM